MKYKILLLSILLFFTCNIYSHSERVHQYIVREAYKLLKNYIGRDISRMVDNVGYKETGGYLDWYNREKDFKEGKLVTGAFREDVKDIVYGYGESIIPGIDEGMQYALASVTHFWNADGGDNQVTQLVGQPYKDIPNALQKMYVYAFDNWITLPGKVDAFTLTNEPVYLIGLDLRTTCFHYNDLINFYKTGLIYMNIAIVGKNNGREYTYVESNFYLNKELREKITWEILGRMAHLLADMSVPAHVHNDSHSKNWQ